MKEKKKHRLKKRAKLLEIRGFLQKKNRTSIVSRTFEIKTVFTFAFGIQIILYNVIR